MQDQEHETPKRPAWWRGPDGGVGLGRERLHDDEDGLPVWGSDPEDEPADGWFEMGDQQTFLEVRPHQRRGWETHRKS